ncbi:MAG: hypothetical protein Q9227_004262 [Pyrenula ochraceoflavens]
MAFSKARRISLLLVIDIIFFLVELIIGQYAHSLALVADSFHMLNDVLSLVVALWAVRIAESGPSAKMTYGWQRAETLGALVNGVFLIALCVSIVLEAIQRFIDPPKISQPMLILIVGCIGFAFNILGLFLFHEHSHGHDHSSQEPDAIDAAEHGHAHYDQEEVERQQVADPNGNVAGVMPQSALGQNESHRYDRPKQSISSTREFPSIGKTENSEAWPINGNISSRHHRRTSRTSGSFGRNFGSVDNILIHPTIRRQELIAAGRRHPDSDSESEDSDSEDAEEAVQEDPTIAPDSDHKNQNLKLLTNRGSPVKASRSRTRSRATSNQGRQAHQQASSNANHNHTKHPITPAESGHGHGHSHGDLNMRGVFLHVMGDALGNIAVIVSALFIWQTNFSWRFYSDPAISLVITIIILVSAVPLCRSAARILLQAVPTGMSVDEIKEHIEALDGIVSCHHLHVWQLSETKYVGSLHVKVEYGVDYMLLANQIKRCLHEFGIHTSTIQPEFLPKEEAEGDNESGENTPILSARGTNRGFGTLKDQQENIRPQTNGTGPAAGALSRQSSTGHRQACLLECVEECAPGKQCCGGKGGNEGKKA